MSRRKHRLTHNGPQHLILEWWITYVAMHTDLALLFPMNHAAHAKTQMSQAELTRKLENAYVNVSVTRRTTRYLV